MTGDKKPRSTFLFTQMRFKGSQKYCVVTTNVVGNALRTIYLGQNIMTDIVQKKIQRGTIIIYATIFLAVGQSILLEIGTTDNGHKIVSIYFIIETLILGLVTIMGFRNRWMRIVLTILTIFETGLFLQDRPISPDELLMIIIFGLRVYVIFGLFNGTMNQYYRNK
jgi:hypothetical protein